MSLTLKMWDLNIVTSCFVWGIEANLPQYYVSILLKMCANQYCAGIC